ncbi:MAG: hypothetical protein J6K61_00820 [Clostridia bacterium]|nr:hypothetical protein [Clostridia bacterium]
MKKRWQTALCLFLLFASLFLSFTSCQRETDQEVLAQAQALLPLSFLVNEMYLGEGIEWDEEGKKIGSYYEAKASSLSHFGVTGLSDIRAKAEAVYSEGVCAQLYSIVLNPLLVDGALVSPKRYYETEGEKEGERLLMVATNYEPIGVGKNTYEDCRLVWCRGKEAEISVKLSVSYKEHPVQTEENATFRLIKENGVWKLDSITVKYYDTEEIAP